MNKEEFLRNLDINIELINKNIKDGLSVNKLAPKLFQCREDNIRKWLKEVGYIRDKTSKLFVVNQPTISNVNTVGENNKVNDELVTKNDKISYEPVIDFSKSAYDIEISEQEDNNIMKITLIEFKDLTIQEKIKIINERAMGKKTLVELSQEDFDFNVSSYMNQYHKGEVQWDGAIKCYKLIGGFKGIQFDKDDIEILKAFIERQKSIKNLLNNTNKGEDKVYSIRCYSNIYSHFKETCEAQNIRIQDALAIALTYYMNKK